MSERVQKLARNLINYSVSLQPGEKILIEVYDDAIPLALALIDETYRAGGLPFITLKNNRVIRSLLMNSTVEQLQLAGELERKRMEEMQAYIGVRAMENTYELSDVPPEKMQLFDKYWRAPVHMQVRVPHTKWCVMRYPNNSMAQAAGKSTEFFEDYYYRVCGLDYAKMDAAMEPLKLLMEATDRVHITGPGTDISFSIKGLPAIKCSGTCNIPDGEIYTAPIRDSINGYITYNVPSLYRGSTFENIRFEFAAGKIVKATCNDDELLNGILDTDAGSRYIGEFALGVNPHINFPMKDTLFDEKIMGSFHLTPGAAYSICDNGNKSDIHWDLVNTQTEEYGGGEIWFDNVLIRKNGLFVLPELAALNPDALG